MSALAPSVALRFGELSFEGEQGSDDDWSDIVQRWKDMLVFEGHSLAKKYVHGRVAFVCDLHASFLCGVKHPASVGNDPFWNREFFASLVYVANIANPLELQFGDDKPMFVLNVETVKLPDGSAIPSLVGLYGLHDVVDDPFRGLVFQSSLGNGTSKLIPGLVRRENHVSRPLASSDEFNFAHGNVESTPQVMNSVTDDAHKLRRDCPTRDEFQRIVSSVCITVHSNIVSVRLGELTDVDTELLDVLSGPFDL